MGNVKKAMGRKKEAMVNVKCLAGIFSGGHSYSQDQLRKTVKWQLIMSGQGLLWWAPDSLSVYNKQRAMDKVKRVRLGSNPLAGFFCVGHHKVIFTN